MKENQKLLSILAINILILVSGFYFFNQKIKSNEILLNSKVELINKLEISNKDLDARMLEIHFGLTRLATSFIWSESIVTNEIIAEKIKFSEKEGHLEIRPQPPMFLKFKGQGNIDMKDREIKSMLLRLIEQIEPIYNDYFKDIKMPSFKKYTIKITNMNYEIATYTNGKITLKGEK